MLYVYIYTYNIRVLLYSPSFCTSFRINESGWRMPRATSLRLFHGFRDGCFYGPFETGQVVWPSFRRDTSQNWVSLV